jgi:hypothetical protein
MSQLGCRWAHLYIHRHRCYVTSNNPCIFMILPHNVLEVFSLATEGIPCPKFPARKGKVLPALPHIYPNSCSPVSITDHPHLLASSYNMAVIVTPIIQDSLQNITTQTPTRDLQTESVILLWWAVIGLYSATMLLLAISVLALIWIKRALPKTPRSTDTNANLVIPHSTWEMHELSPNTPFLPSPLQIENLYQTDGSHCECREPTISELEGNPVRTHDF